MSDYQPFGYEDKPGTCLWCGRKLPVHTALDEERMARENLSYAIKPSGHLGRYGDDMSAGCAAATSSVCRAARLGYRLEMRKES